MTAPPADDRVRPLAPPGPLAAPVPPVALWELALTAQEGDERLALLDDEDRARLPALRPEARALLLARRALLAVAVGALLDVPADGLRWARPGGRPHVTTPDGAALSVSLSTSGTRALAAAAACPVGVDLAVRQPVPEARVLGECLLSASEGRWVADAGDDGAAADRFLRTWVRKEAVVKATGEGLAGRPPQGFTVDARTDDARPVRGLPRRRLGVWTCGVPLPGAHAALAWSEAPAAEGPDGPWGCTWS